MNNVLLIPLYVVTTAERLLHSNEKDDRYNYNNNNNDMQLKQVVATIAVKNNKTKSDYHHITRSFLPMDANNVSTTFGENSTVSTEFHMIRNYWALVLLIIPVMTLFGNLLVICSVVRYRNLHSAINYFILGLAFADLMVALAVMPFAVYVQFNNGVWELGEFMCDLYCATDVTCSTASIFLLTIISFDRYMAATQPIKYLNSNKGVVHVALTNLVVWFVSMLIASPMVLGLNNVRDRDPKECRFYNADFIIYSSTGSFCIPLAFMMYLYARIYQVIRRRGKINRQRHASKNNSLVGAKRPSTLHANNEDHNCLMGSKENEANLKDSDKDVDKVDNNKLNISPPELAPTYADSGVPPSFCQPFVDDTVHEALLPKTDGNSPINLRNFERHAADSMLFANEMAREHDTTHSLTETPPSAEDRQRTMSRRSSSWMPNMTPVITSFGRPWSRASQDVFGQQPSPKSTAPAPLRVSRVTNSSSSDSVDSSSDNQDAVVAADVSTYYANVGGMVLMKIQERQRAMLANGAADNHMRQPSISNLLHRKKMNRKAYKSAKKEKKATKTLAIVLGVFLICWLPFFTLNLVNAICIKINVNSCQIGFIPFFLTTWFGYMNSIMNPVIYTVFNLEFRKAFKRCLCPCLLPTNNEPRRV